jgi:hypothetical protein
MKSLVPVKVCKKAVSTCAYIEKIHVVAGNGASRPSRQDCRAAAVYRRGYLRCDPASDQSERLNSDRGNQ